MKKKKTRYFISLMLLAIFSVSTLLQTPNLTYANGQPNAESPMINNESEGNQLFSGDIISFLVSDVDESDEPSVMMDLLEAENAEDYMEHTLLYINDKYQRWQNDNDSNDYAYYNGKELADKNVKILVTKPFTLDKLEVNGIDFLNKYQKETTKDITVIEGNKAHLSINVKQPSDNGTLSYQWQESNNGIDWIDVTTGTGATSSNFITEPTILENSQTYYRCVVTNTLSEDNKVAALSSPKKVTVLKKATPITITTLDNGIGEEEEFIRMIDREVYELSVSIDESIDKEKVSFQWQYSHDGGNRWINWNYSENTEQTFLLLSNLVYDDYQFRVIVTYDDGNGNVVSTISNSTKPVIKESRAEKPAFLTKVKAKDELSFRTLNREDNDSGAMFIRLESPSIEKHLNTIIAEKGLNMDDLTNEDITNIISDNLLHVTLDQEVADISVLSENELMIRSNANSDSWTVSQKDVSITFQKDLFLSRIALDYDRRIDFTFPETKKSNEGERVVLDSNVLPMQNDLNSTFSYQWQQSTDGTNWVDILGAVSSTYEINNVQMLNNNTKYRAVVTNTLSKRNKNILTSNEITLEVVPVNNPGPNPEPTPEPKPDPKPEEKPIIPDFENIEDHWMEENIDTLINEGFFDGINITIDLNKSMQRGFFVELINRLDSKDPEVIKPTLFTDINKSDYYYNSVNWAYLNKLVQGTTSTTFSPERTIQRQEMAYILDKYIELKKLHLTSHSNGQFKDINSIAAWSRPSVKKMKDWMILKGDSNNKFNPYNELTNAEGLAVIYRIYNLNKK